MDRSLNIKAVSRLSGVSSHTLRAWERRYSAVKPSRTDTGRRVYSLKDVERLRMLMLLVEQDYTISGIAHLTDEALKAMLAEAAGGAERFSVKAHILSSVLEPSIMAEAARFETESGGQATTPGLFLERVLDALSRFQLRELSATLALARSKLTPREFTLQLVAPLLGEVGVQVERGMMTIAQEHALSATLRDQIAFLLQGLHGVRSKSSVRIALATAEGELHEFGILLSAVLCACHGLDFHYLGPNLPFAALAHAAAKLEANVVVLGISEMPDTDLAVPLEKYVRQLERKLTPDCELWIGGRGRLDKDTATSKRTIRHLGTLEALDRLLESRA